MTRPGRNTGLDNQTTARTATLTLAPVHPPIHPGEIIADELGEICVSQSDLARALGVPRSRISEIIRGIRPIIADTGLRLSRYFRRSAT